MEVRQFSQFRLNNRYTEVDRNSPGTGMIGGLVSMLFDNKGFSDDPDEIGESKGRKLIIVVLLLLFAGLFIVGYYEFASTWRAWAENIGIG